MPGGNPAANVRAGLATATAVNLGMGSRAGPRSEGESRTLVMATPGCVEVDGAAAGQPRPDVEGKRTVCELRGAADAWQANHSGHRPEARHPAPNLDASVDPDMDGAVGTEGVQSAYPPRMRLLAARCHDGYGLDKVFEGHRADHRVEDRSPNGSLGAAFGFGSWITHSSSGRRRFPGPLQCEFDVDGLSHGALRGDARRHGPAPSPAPIRDATPAGGPNGWSPVAGNG